MSFITKASGMSLLGQMAYDVENEPNYEDMNEEELETYMEDLIEKNKILTIENEIFERFLARHDPQALVSMSQVLETAKMVTSKMPHDSSPHARPTESVGGINLPKDGSFSAPSSPSSVGSAQSFSGSRVFPSVLSDQFSTKGFRITLSHRIEMTNKEIEEMTKQIMVRERQIEIKKAHLKAQSEEAQLRLRDTEEMRKEFEETVIKKGTDPKTGKISTKIFNKFMETWMKNTERTIDKLRLKCLSIKSQIKEAEKQLEQKEELGKTLHAIDFEALIIENKDYSNKVKEKNKELVELKRVMGRYNLELSNSKAKLNEKQKILDDLKKKINTTENYVAKLKKEMELSKFELEKMDQQIAEITETMKERELPDILEFIKMQTELEEMEKTQKRIERHKNIQMTAFKTFKKNQKQLNQTKLDESSKSE